MYFMVSRLGVQHKHVKIAACHTNVPGMCQLADWTFLKTNDEEVV